MATRSRTALFLQLRQSVPRPARDQRGVLAPTAEAEKVGLIAESAVGPATTVDVGAAAVALPPVWVDTVEDIEATVERIRTQMNQLEGLHKKHLLPGFDDRNEQEQTIEHATREITLLFKKCQQQIKAFELAEDVRAKQRKASGQEVHLHKNVTASLATKVAQLSSEFRKSQSNYMTRLKNRSIKSSPLFALSDDDDPPTGQAAFEPFTDQQMSMVANNEAAITQREREINEIAKNIAEIAELFKDMQTMIIDQGSLLDRIDYNMVQAANNVEAANEQLDKAAQYQVSARKKQMICLLILGIVFLIFLVMIKSKSR